MRPAIVCGSHVTGLGIIRSLGIHGIPILAISYESTDMGQVSRFAGKALKTPNPLASPDAFVEFLFNLPCDYSGAVLFAGDDAALSAVSKRKSDLESRFVVACPQWETANRCLDKRYTYELAERVGIPVPRTCHPKSLEDIHCYLEEYRFPCIVKPCTSHIYQSCFKKKMVLVGSEKELLREFRRAHECGIDVMIQEYIPGDDTCGANFNSLFWNGACFAHFTAEKVRLSNGGFGVPCVVRHKEIPDIVEYGTRIIGALGLSGYSCTEFKRDPRDGRYKLMEVNGRHNRSGLLALKCGINFALMEYALLTNSDCAEAVSKLNKEVFWIDEFKDIMTWLRPVCSCRYPPFRYFEPYFRKNVYAVFDRKDMKPFLKRARDCFKAVLGKK